MRYIVILSYDGSAFNGWQQQDNAPSVQESLSKGLETLLGGPVQVTGAGRTDTSVNAVNYVAHFDTGEGVGEFDCDRIAYKLNAIVPSGITVHSIVPSDSDFHARFSAKRREYCYFIHFRKDPFAEKYSFRSKFPLDIEKMNEAAGKLCGTKDFSCFEKTGGGNATSICTVLSAGWETYKPTHVEVMGYPYEEGDYIVFRIAADRFLRNMVRAIVGTLVDVGRGKIEPEAITALIESQDRCKAGQSVPGNALFLTKISY